MGCAARKRRWPRDEVALARDEDVTGGMTDLLLSNSNLQRAYTTCTPIGDAAPRGPRSPGGSCERANAFAAATDHRPPSTRGQRLELVRAWNDSRAAVSPPGKTYNEAYSLTLRVLDKLTEHAKSR